MRLLETAVSFSDEEYRELMRLYVDVSTERNELLGKLDEQQKIMDALEQRNGANIERAGELQSRLHQLSEDHSHCEDLLHELGARASSAENRLDAIRRWHADHDEAMFRDIWAELGALLDPAVENQKPIAREQPIGKFAVLRDVRPDDPHTHKWVTDSLVGPTVCEICGIKVGGE
jgi:predicted nuclease with TOPRIM domain